MPQVIAPRYVAPRDPSPNAEHARLRMERAPHGNFVDFVYLRKANEQIVTLERQLKEALQSIAKEPA